MSEVKVDEILIGAPIDEKDKLNKKKEVFEVDAFNVVAAGGFIVTAVAGLTATSTYKSGTKSLVEDGINPNVRVSLIPMAARALMLSTLLTGVFGMAGFYILKENGMFTTDRAELLSAKEMARILRNPKKYWEDATSNDK